MSTRPPMIISSPTAQPDSPEVSSTAPRDLHVLRGAGLALLLIGSAVLYLWGLSESGWANSYYSAAVQAGSQSWKAFLFGSLDASNAVTVDTPPASLWLMALSVRIFGLNSWSILVPQALLGVATVAVLYASVRRTVDPGRSRSADSTLATGHVAGLVAGAVLALTPVAVLIFRFNTPDALLVFLLTATGYCTLRASEEASGKWLVGAGVLVGLAFLTKMWPAFVVLPALVVVYLVVAPTSMGRRIRHLLAALIAMIISLGWWVALVELVPESWRPYVGGSDNNSVLGLIFGDHGLNRMLEGGSGGMIAWLIPAALLLGTFALIIRHRAPRTDGVRAAIMVWGGTLLVTALSFLLMAGGSDDGYDPVALAPATAALVAVGGQVLWVRRRSALARAGLAATMIITGLTAYALLGRATAPHAILQWPVLIICALAAGGLLAAHRLPRLLAAMVLGLALVGATAAPAAYAAQTVATPHPGSTAVSAAVQNLLRRDADSYDWVAATPGAPRAAAYQLATGRPVMAVGGFAGSDNSPTLKQFQAYVADGRVHFYLGGGGSGALGSSAAEIEAWVSQNFPATTVDGVTLHDLGAA